MSITIKVKKDSKFDSITFISDQGMKVLTRVKFDFINNKVKNILSDVTHASDLNEAEMIHFASFLLEVSNYLSSKDQELKSKSIEEYSLFSIDETISK